jgi:hypothetical protein
MLGSGSIMLIADPAAAVFPEPATVVVSRGLVILEVTFAWVRQRRKRLRAMAENVRERIEEALQDRDS